MWVAMFWAVVAAGPAAFEQELSEFKLADGFQIELFAADPSIAKPIQMNFDAKGRLWLATSESYPQLEPGAEPRDKVYILDDTDHDGKADKSTVFADKLHIPTGIEVGSDGAWVANSTELLYLRDKDGDGTADDRQIVLTAFGTEDTHHLIHTFRWGPGGHLYFAQAVYIHSHVETPFGVKRLNGGGFWKFETHSGKLDIFVTGMTNSWGIAFDEYGQAFGVDNDQYSVNYFLPGAHLIRTPDESHILPSLVVGKPKYCGAEFVTSPNFPDDWQGDFLTCDFRAHRICRYKISDKEAGYKAEEQPELLSTANVAFRPVDLKFGPDGALYVCDWFNPIINHGEVDFRDPRRDKTHGRIWRISRTDRPQTKRVDLGKASSAELLDLQKSKSGFERHFARRMLLARPRQDELETAIDAWLAKQTDERILLRGLWSCQTVGHVKADLLEKLLKAKDGHVRSAAVRVLSDWRGRIENAEEMFRAAVADEHPRVRVEAIRALAETHKPEAMAWALEAMGLPMDPVIEYALKLNARETTKYWLGALKEGTLSREPAERWIFALLAVDRPVAVEPLLAYWRDGKVKDEGAVLSFVGRHGDPASLRMLLDRAMDQSTSSELRSRILNALSTAHRLRQAKPMGELGPAVSSLLGVDDPTIREHGVRLAGQWGIEAARGRLAEIAKDSKVATEREAAIESIRTLGGVESIRQLRELFVSTSDSKDQAAALKALVTLDATGAVELVAPILKETSTGRDVGAIYAAIVTSREGPAALTTKLATAPISKESAEAGIKQVNASGQAMPGLVAALRKAGGLPIVERSVSPEQLAKTAGEAMRSGDAHRGKEIYERKTLACATCHVIRGTGGKVGPDLTSIGTSAPVDYLVESLLAPGAKVKEGYHSMVVVTDEGKVVTGIPERQSETEVVLKTAEDKTVSIAKSSIDESKMGGSLMPTDAVDALSPQELLDLVRYLAELGKPGPFGPSQELVARKWKLLGPLAADVRDKATSQVLTGSAESLDWRDSLTTNDGWVYLREFALSPAKPVFLATTRITVKSPGKARLTIEPGPKGEYWLDGKPLSGRKSGGEESEFDVDLAAGEHVLLVRIDLAKVPQKMKVRGYPLDGKAEFELEKP